MCPSFETKKPEPEEEVTLGGSEPADAGLVALGEEGGTLETLGLLRSQG